MPVINSTFMFQPGPLPRILDLHPTAQSTNKHLSITCLEPNLNSFLNSAFTSFCPISVMTSPFTQLRRLKNLNILCLSPLCHSHSTFSGVLSLALFIPSAPPPTFPLLLLPSLLPSFSVLFLSPSQFLFFPSLHSFLPPFFIFSLFFPSCVFY